MSDQLVVGEEPEAETAGDVIHNAAGEQMRVRQLTELPGESWEDIFGDAA